MSETTTAPNALEQLGLTAEEEALRQQAETWVMDAKATCEQELIELRDASTTPSLGGTATRAAMAPSISSAPAHIKRGTQIDQQIWQAENAEEENYDAPDAPPTAEELKAEAAQQDRDDTENVLLNILHGSQEYDEGLNGDIEIITEGIEPHTGEPLDRKGVEYTIEKFAQLQAEREKAIAEDQPDPLKDQLAATYPAAHRL